MPRIKSAKKALRQNIRRREKNLQRTKTMKDLIKQISFFVSEKKKEEALKLLPQVYKAIDKSAKIGLLKKNTASRKKSGLARLINKI